MTAFDYDILYDESNNIVITPEIKKIIEGFGLNANDNVLELFVPTKPEYYHSKKTPKIFKDTHLLQEVARYKEKHGVYSPYPFNSLEYRNFWKEQKRRCLEGYTINKGTEYELSITGYHYFFLNFKKLLVVNKKTKQREYTFPRFYATHYHFYWAYQEAKNNKHLCLLKARGIGASEIISAIAVCNYTFFRENNFLFAYDEGKLLGDGVFSKVNDHLDYLFSETERAFRHLRTGTESNQVLKKRASTKMKDGSDKVTGGYIEGRIVDEENKARGSRGIFIGFEEAGSFKNLTKAVTVARPSVEEDEFSVYGTIVVWGTGGSKNEYVEGLETIFYAPDAFNFKGFKNKWDKVFYDEPCGLFFPCYSTIPYYMDSDGNVDELRAYLSKLIQRKKIIDSSGEVHIADDNVAEYPFTPQEALRRQTKSPFNLRDIQQQLNYVLANKNLVVNSWTNGDLKRDKNEIKFIPNPSVRRLDDYPITEDIDKTGCISILERPRKVQGVVPRHLYTLAVDNYSNDFSETSESVGACYVIKNMSVYVPSNNLTGNIVAEYVGRPTLLQTFWENVFLLAEYYNTTINFEARGGGQTAVDYARRNKKLHLLEYVPEILAKNDTPSKRYGVTFTKDDYNNTIKYLADWLQEEVQTEYHDKDEEPITIKRIQNIYSLGLLRELSRFVIGNNYDRIDALKLAVLILKNNTYTNRKAHKDTRWKEVLQIFNKYNESTYR